MKVKEMIGGVLAQLVAEDDPIKRTEIIDGAESLETDIPEANEDGEDYEAKYTELEQKYLKRFGESLNPSTEVDEDPDPEPTNDEDVDPDPEDTRPKTYEEAGITT